MIKKSIVVLSLFFAVFAGVSSPAVAGGYCPTRPTVRVPRLRLVEVRVPVYGYQVLPCGTVQFSIIGYSTGYTYQYSY